jgi:hypothetical protein
MFGDNIAMINPFTVRTSATDGEGQTSLTASQVSANIGKIVQNDFEKQGLGDLMLGKVEAAVDDAESGRDFKISQSEASDGSILTAITIYKDNALLYHRVLTPAEIKTGVSYAKKKGK